MEFSLKYSKSMKRPICIFLGDFFLPFLSLLHNKIAPSRLTRNEQCKPSQQQIFLSAAVSERTGRRGEEGGGGQSFSKVGVGSQHTGCLMFRTHSWQVRSSENNILCLSGAQTGSNHAVRGGAVFAENALPAYGIML